MDSQERRKLDRMFRPRSVAVVGASRREGSLGWQVLHNLILFGFNGKIFPVNPQAEVIHSMKCYPAVDAIEDEVDLAVIIVPAASVPAVVEACGRKGVGGIVVLSAGFGELGGEGLKRERELAALVARHGMRMIGPNCMGILNAEPDVRMDAVFAQTLPLSGNVAFTSQSGAMGAAIINHAAGSGLGFSMFASIGNKADISSNDLLEYWEDDDQSQVILLYVESFGDPRRFTSIARRLTRKKPVLAVKTGRTAVGARAASSHTGALAGADVAVDALFAQCGVLRVDTLEELFDVARAFASQPVPRGKRVGIVTNAGGPGIMAIDTLVPRGLEVPVPPAEVLERLARHLPAEATLSNPLDLIGSATAREYRLAVEAFAACDSFDALIVICVPTVVHDPTDVYLEVAEVAEMSGKPCLGVFMSADDVRKEAARRRPDTALFPVYRYPESAATALEKMCAYRERMSESAGQHVVFQVDRPRAEAVIARAQAEGRSELGFAEAQAVFAAYGVPFAPSRVVPAEGEALQAAQELGWPVALKALGAGLSHKSDLSGVAVDLAGPEALVAALRRMREDVERATGAAPVEFLVQKMVPGGLETIVGMSHDPSFGPLMMFGLGGIYVEVLGDVSFSIVPLTDHNADALVRGIRAWPILAGVRGESGVDLDRLREVILRVSQLVDELPAIEELDLNPFMASSAPARCLAVDARMRLRPRGAASNRAVEATRAAVKPEV